MDHKPENVKSLVWRLSVDEAILKYDGKKILFAAVDLERNKIIPLGVYPARSSMTSHAFLRRVLWILEEIALDRGPITEMHSVDLA